MAVSEVKRLPMFDELRGLAIIGVIAIHTAAHDVGNVAASLDYWLLTLQTMLFRFAVPSFLIVSGFFISCKEQDALQGKLKDIIIRRIQKVAFPYVIWSALYFLIFLLLGVQFSRNPAIIFFEKLLTGSVVLHLYFLTLIIQLYLFSYFGFMENGHATKMTMILAVAAFLVFTIPLYMITIDASELAVMKAGYYFRAFERSFFPRWLLFFMLGRWMGIHWKEVEYFTLKHRRLLSLSVVISFVFCWLDFYILRLYSENMHLLPPDWMISCLLFGSLFTVWFLTLRTRNNLMLGWLGKLGAVSFGVYLLHEPFLSLLMSSNFWLSNIGILPNIFIRQSVAILSGLGVSLIIFAALQRILPTRARRYMLG